MPTVTGACVMVAGGAGFVGSSVVRELLRRSARVVCFDNFLHGCRRMWPAWGRASRSSAATPSTRSRS